MGEDEGIKSNELTDYHGRHVQYGQVHEFTHGRAMVMLCGQFAGDLIKQAVQGFGLPPDEAAAERAVRRAAEMAEAFFEEIKRRGWVIPLPPLTESEKTVLTREPHLSLAQMGQRRN